MKLIKKRNLLLVLLLLLIGCSTDPPQNIPSILEDLVCEPPCWQNIIPGETTEQELLTIIDKIPNLEKDSVYIRGNSWNIFSNLVSFDLVEYNFVIEVVIYLYEDIVALINLSGDVGIDIGNAISVLGEPKSILIPFFDSYYPVFLNESIGIAYMYDAYYLPNKFREEITPEIIIDQIDFFYPKLFTQLLELLIDPVDDPQLLFGKIYPWNGFGNIKEKYCP